MNTRRNVGFAAPLGLVHGRDRAKKLAGRAPIYDGAHISLMVRPEVYSRRHSHATSVQRWWWRSATSGQSYGHGTILARPRKCASGLRVVLKASAVEAEGQP